MNCKQIYNADAKLQEVPCAGVLLAESSPVLCRAVPLLSPKLSPPAFPQSKINIFF